jgi:TolB-like protein/Tfp pilus assembly protein PilF
MSEKSLPVYEFGPFRLNTAERRLMRAGRAIPLTGKTFDLLLALVSNSGSLLKKEELLRMVWPGSFVAGNNLTVRMCALRKALGEDHRTHQYIETMSGEGYRFIARVRTIEEQNDETIAEAASKQRHDINSLAVLPFMNAAADTSLDYLSDGLTENIINSLSQLSPLRVIARSTVFRFKGTEHDPIETGCKLGVDAVLTGRVIQLGGKLIVSVELADVRDGTQVWGETYNQLFADIFEVQEQIARKVSEKLRLRLTSEESKQLVKQHTANIEAYHLYLKGRYFWNKRNEEGVRKGVEFFRRAIEVDPNYALAYTGLADAYHSLCGLGIVDPQEGYPKAKAAALTALALDERLAEAHASLGIIGLRYDWDWAMAEGEFKRAMELNPNYAIARHWYALYLATRTRFDEAIMESKAALKLDPLSLIINTLLGSYYFLARRYDEGIAQLQRTLELDPNFIYAYSTLAECYYYSGRHTEAVAAMERACELFGWDTWPALTARGYIYAATGRRGEARSLLAELLRRSKREFVSAYEIAKVYAHLGCYEKALDWLNVAYEQRDPAMMHILSMPELSPFRTAPRFQELARRMGLAN